MSLVRIIRTDKAEFGELVDSDYEVTGNFWHYRLEPNDDEGRCAIVGDVYILVGTNKKTYILMGMACEAHEIIKKNYGPHWRRKISFKVPKDIAQILTEQEENLYRNLFE